jgi:hypothetical protein
MGANDVDIPGLKEILWHRMRDDLKNYIPEVANTELLICPTCCRFLPFEHFNGMIVTCHARGSVLLWEVAPRGDGPMLA